MDLNRTHLWLLLVFFGVTELTMLGGGADFTLTVFGNANLDDVVDAKDIEYIRDTLNGTKEATEFADANYDSKIDETDIHQIQAIIDRTEETLTFKETSGRIVSVKMPVEKVSLLTPEHSEGMRWLKATDMVVGVTQKWERERPEYFPELSKSPIVGSFFEPDYEAIIVQGSDIVFTWSSWTSPGAEEMQDTLDQAGITVVGLDLYRPSTFTNEVKIMGMILHKEDEADQFIDFYQSKIDEIKERVGSIPEEQRKIVYYEYMSPYNTFGSNNELAEVFDIVGAKSAFDDPFERFDVSAEDVMVKNPDIIIKEPYIFGYTLTNTSVLEKASDELISRPELAEVKAVTEENVYVLTFEVCQASSIPVILPAYLAKLLYPEKFQDFDLEAYMKEYLEDYQGIPYQGVYYYPPT